MFKPSLTTLLLSTYEVRGITVIYAEPTHLTPKSCWFPSIYLRHRYHAHFLLYSVFKKFNMASLNLSTNGPSIKSSYTGVVNSPAPSGPAANSPTYGQWAIFSVSAPLVNAFQQDSAGKESVLKVQSTGGKFFIIAMGTS